ncbi:hypothetical protein [Angustibacter luteus]|uniref:DUF4239 domain-containing protein n=1 Tax=Angustibacter luteus TaxID=658456 RepID=A0ABW1JBY0_9ACTN
MGLATLVGLDSDTLGPRFSLVSLLPTSAGTLVVAFVVAAGAPGEQPGWDEAVRTARTLDASDVALLGVAVLVVAVVLHPLQLQLVRLLEGYWGTGWLAARITAPLVARQRNARQALIERATLDPATTDPAATSVPADAAVADQVRRARYPSDPLLPTALGNALRAAERSAGRRYGLDAVVLWPRLYPIVPPAQRAVVEDRRDQLDLTARMCATFAGVAVVTAALLWRYPLWWLLPLGVLALSVLAYRSAVAAALSYGEALHVTFDLYRFDLLAALHLPLPADNAAERQQNKALSTWLRQGGPAPEAYRHLD